MVSAVDGGEKIIICGDGSWEFVIFQINYFDGLN